MTGKALPAPAEAASESPSTPEPKIEETIPEPKAEAITEPVKEVNSAPPTEQPKPRPTYSSPYYAVSLILIELFHVPFINL